ncbi:unnamed protein product [Merluccius merluccius]
MAPKRVRSGGQPAAGATDSSWRSGLRSAQFEESSWRACVSLLAAGTPADEELIVALQLAVQQPQRRLFTLLCEEAIVAMIHDLGNPKAKRPKDVPMYSEVTVPAKVLLDAGEDVPSEMMANILKFQLLQVKASDQQRRAARQGSEEKAESTAGPASATKHKASDNRAKKATAPGGVATEKQTRLKRRGEDIETHKYIDDEPEAGPQHYILLTGFKQPQLLSALEAVGVHVDNVIKLEWERTHINSRGSSEGRDMSGAALLLTGHMFLDNRTLQIQSPPLLLTSHMFLDHRIPRLWEDTLGLLRKDVDMRYYDNLLDQLPPEACSIPLILHCMLEQVVMFSPENGESVARPELEPNPPGIDGCLARCMLDNLLPLAETEEDRRRMLDNLLPLARTEEERRLMLDTVLTLAPDHQHSKAPQGLDPVTVEESMLQLSSLWRLIGSAALQGTSCTMDAFKQQVLHYCTSDEVSLSTVEHMVHQRALESMPITGVDQQGVLVKNDPRANGKQQPHHSQGRNTSSLLDMLEIFQRSRLRSLSDYRHAEHHNTNDFPQVLQSAMDSYLCVDSFHSPLDNTVYIICHSPRSPQRHCYESWDTVLHTDAWKLDQEQRQQEAELGKKGGRDSIVKRGVSPTRDSEDKNTSARTKRQETPTTAPPGGQNQRRPTPGSPTTASPRAQNQRRQTPGSPTTAPPGGQNQRSRSTEVFHGYRMGGELIHVSGQLQHLFPSDGGHVTVEKSAEEQSACRPFNSLHMSGPNGLTLQFLAEDTHVASPGVHNVLVRQSMYARRDRVAVAMPAELSRVITSQGAVVRHMRDGSTEVLFPDGSVSFSPDSGPVWPPDAELRQEEMLGEKDPVTPLQRGHWITTAPSGARVCTVGSTHEHIPTASVLSVHATDPLSQAVMQTRQDRVVCVQDPDGTLTVEHADGTRITSFHQEKTTDFSPTHRHTGECPRLGRDSGQPMVAAERVVLVEREGLATVVVYPERGAAHVFLADGTSAAVDGYGVYQVFPSNTGRLLIGRDGTCLYSSDPAPFSPRSQSGSYTLSTTHGVTCDITDPEGNHFQVKQSGQVSVVLSSASRTSEPDEEAGQDCMFVCVCRMFLVHVDGSGTELLVCQEVESLLQQAHSDPAVALLTQTDDAQGQCSTITILRPVQQLPGKHNPNIVPLNLRNRNWHTFPRVERKSRGPPFGSDLGHGLARSGGPPVQDQPGCPRALQVQELTVYPPISNMPRHTLDTRLKGFTERLLRREQLSEDMRVSDPHSEAEERLLRRE